MAMLLSHPLGAPYGWPSSYGGVVQFGAGVLFGEVPLYPSPNRGPQRERLSLPGPLSDHCNESRGGASPSVYRLPELGPLLGRRPRWRNRDNVPTLPSGRIHDPSN